MNEREQVEKEQLAIMKIITTEAKAIIQRFEKSGDNANFTLSSTDVSVLKFAYKINRDWVKDSKVHVL